jgi:hypothetical protein
VSLILNEPDLTHDTAQKLNENAQKTKKCGTFAWSHKKISAVVHRSVSTQTTGFYIRINLKKKSKRRFTKIFLKK